MNDDKRVTLLVCISMFIVITIIAVVICTYKVDAAEYKTVSFAECKCNHTLYFLKQAELLQEWEDEYEREQERTDRWRDVDDIVDGLTKERYINIFGYVPSEWEIDLLKRAITAECGYREPDTGVERVLCVIANRCRQDGRTIYQVLSAPGQFETWSNRRIQTSGVSEQVNRIVDDTIRRGYLSDRNIMFFTAGRYNEYSRPAYVIGNHYFGY